MSATNFGRETSCLTGLRTGRFVSGARIVGESVYRRLTTPRGMLRGGEEDLNFGLDLTELIGSVSTRADAAALPGRIQTELSKDERIESAEVEVIPITDGPATTFVVTVIAQTNAGPFTLQVRATEVTVELIGLTAEG